MDNCQSHIQLCYRHAARNIGRRASPYDGILCQVAKKAPDSEHMSVPKGWTAGELAAHFAQGSVAPQFAVDGFVIPHSEPLARILRESDEVLVIAPEVPHVTSPCVPSDDNASEDLTLRNDVNNEVVQKNPADAHFAALARLAEERGARAAELTATMEAQASQIAELEGRVRELARELKAAQSKLGEFTNASALHMRSKPSSEEHQNIARLPNDSYCQGSRQRGSGIWHPTTADKLSAGDAIRYRVMLTDAWRGDMQPSPKRFATVAKLLSHKPEDGLVLVLRHKDGAMDCLEESRIFDLHVNATQ